jgi:hypothetical protein
MDDANFVDISNAEFAFAKLPDQLDLAVLEAA